MLCLSPNGSTLAEATHPADVVLVGTSEGVVRLEKQQDEWRVGQRALPEDHISALLPVADQDAVFAGIHHGTVRISRDQGRTWQVCDHGFQHHHVYTLNCVTRGGSTRLYAGTEPAHFYESGDLGQSWRELDSLMAVPNKDRWSFPAPPHIGHVKHIAFDPWDPHVIYVCVEQDGIYRSFDAGETWDWISRDIYPDVHRVVISAQHPNRLHVPGGDGLYASEDGGRTWTHVINRVGRIAYPDALVAHPRLPALMYMAGARTTPPEFAKTGDADSRVARSQDGGRSWEMLGDGFPDHMQANIEAMTMAVWPAGHRVFAGTTDGEVFCSLEGGRRWRRIARGLPPISKLGHHEVLQRGRKSG